MLVMMEHYYYYYYYLPNPTKYLTWPRICRVLFKLMKPISS